MKKKAPRNPDAIERFVALPGVRPGVEALFAESGQVFDRHTHDAFAFGLIDRGGQKWFSGLGHVEGRAGDVIMSNPGEVHDGRPIETHRVWRMLHVEPHVVWDLVSQLDYGRPGEFEFANPVVHDPVLAQRMSMLLTASAHQLGGLRFDELLLQVLAALGQRRLRSDPGFSRIDHARAQIDDHPEFAWSLADLAQACGLTQWQLLRSFAKATGFTPHAYQIQRRVELARTLIRQGVSLANAAALSGFADQSHMTRIFRRRYGFTPSAWAASVRTPSGGVALSEPDSPPNDRSAPDRLAG